MTCREKLKMEHPEKVGKAYFGGCSDCPSKYGYLVDPKECEGFTNKNISCEKCWDREIPEEKVETKEKKEIQLDDINDIFEFLGECIINHGIPVSIFVSDTGTTVNINPHLVDKGDEKKC